LRNKQPDSAEQQVGSVLVSKAYRIGFARTALLRETVVVAQLFNELKDWSQVKQTVIADNVLQARAIRTGSIIFSEIHKRLTLLTDEQIELIGEDSPQDVRQLVWIGICKQYQFIGEFSVEVLAAAVASRRYEITYDDYGYFFNAKAEWHPKLEQISDKTRSNSRQMLFQMMRQCELLNDSGQLIPQLLSAAIQNCSPESDLAFIPGAIRL
tara:strand:+ start:790 stop:1422 length:633 start_codon:yes stop_codon:yes gene_type:complete